jgi:hypothetical protein
VARGKWRGRFGYDKAWPESGRSTEYSREPKAQTDRAPNLLKCSVQVSSAFQGLATSQWQHGIVQKRKR